MPTPTLAGITWPDASSPSETLISPPEFSDVHPTGLYRFLMESLRTIDEMQGIRFLERFMVGPDELWARLQQKMWRATKLQSPALTPDVLAEHLLQLVGFGRGADLAETIAKKLATKIGTRKLAKLAASYWVRRGRRDALEASIRLVTGLRPAVDDWFLVRMVLDEVLLGEEGGPTDPWLVWSDRVSRDAGPAAGDDDWAENHVSIRVPGLTTDAEARTLVTDICELARPLGERYEIAFVEFVDLFYEGILEHWVKEDVTTPGPSWSPGVESTDLVVTPAKLPGMILHQWTWVRLDWQNSATWDDFLFTFLVKLSSTSCDLRVAFRMQTVVHPSTQYYEVRLTPSTGALILYQVGVGVVILDSAVVEVGLATYSIRVHAEGTQLRVYWDGDLVLEATDVTWTAGTIALYCNGPDDLEIQRVEIFQLPLTSTLLVP